MRLDLRDKLTVFIITCGDNPNLVDAVTAINNQTCDVQVDIIKDFTPMSKAFQEMLNRVQTPYYIQVDEDMVLYPDTIQKMFLNFKCDSTLAMDCYLLKDVHLNMDIEGVKIYNSSIFKKYPYNLKHPSCEVEQIDRMIKDGYYIGRIADVVGLHAPKWTNEAIFERYYNLAMKYRLFGYHWMGELKEKLPLKYKQERNELNFFALEGYMYGLLARRIVNEEKDANKHLDEFKTAELNWKRRNGK